MNKIIVCNGGYRTGSTLSFMIVLRLLRFSGVAGLEVESIGASDKEITSLFNLEPTLLRNWWVVKCHRYWPPKEGIPEHCFVIHTFRPALQVAASLHVIKPNLTFEQIAAELHYQHTVKKKNEYRGSLCIPYTKIYGDIDWTVRAITNFLSIPIEEHAIDWVANELSIESVSKLCKLVADGAADPYTQLRHNQISDTCGHPEGWKQTLPDGWEDKIRKMNLDEC